MKYRLLGLIKLRLALLSALLMLAAVNSAFAETLEVRSTGKDLNTALLNAQVVAVRAVMNDMLSKDYVKSHIKELRGIIADAPTYTDKPVPQKQTDQNNLVELISKVEVNRSKLAETLRALGATIVKSYKEVFTQRKMLAEQVLNSLFGDKSELSVKSTLTPPFDSVLPQTEELADENYIYGPVSFETFAPQQRFTLTYHRDEESAKRDGYYLIVAASVPLTTFTQSLPQREINTEKGKLQGREGMFDLLAPVNPGNYEVRLFNQEDGPCVARWGFKVTQELGPALQLERNVFAPEETFNIYYENTAL